MWEKRIVSMLKQVVRIVTIELYMIKSGFHIFNVTFSVFLSIHFYVSQFFPVSLVEANVNVMLILNGGLIKLWNEGRASCFGQLDFP
jgi:hypothetical protein